MEAGPDEAGLLDDTPPPLPLLQLLLPLPCRCSVAEVEGGATLMFRPMWLVVERVGCRLWSERKHAAESPQSCARSSVNFIIRGPHLI